MFWLTTVPSKFVVKIAPDNWAYDGAARTSAPIATRTHDRRCFCILFLLDFKMMMPTQPRPGMVQFPFQVVSIYMECIPIVLRCFRTGSSTRAPQPCIALRFCGDFLAFPDGSSLHSAARPDDHQVTTALIWLARVRVRRSHPSCSQDPAGTDQDRHTSMSWRTS